MVYLCEFALFREKLPSLRVLRDSLPICPRACHLSRWFNHKRLFVAHLATRTWSITIIIIIITTIKLITQTSQMGHPTEGSGR